MHDKITAHILTVQPHEHSVGCQDWAQRQPPGECHDFYSQHSSFWNDTWLQLHCDIALKHPPAYQSDCTDPVMLWMDRWWRSQQLPWVIGLGLLGGPLWVTWGVCGRVLASTYGHFFVGWFAHNPGMLNSWLGPKQYFIQG